MCRWVAYLGAPIAPKELLHDPERSLIEQSRRHAPNMAIPNGDGTGLGWYDHRAEPALFRSIVPAWGDENLLELAAEIRSPLFLAHVRAGTGTPVQQTNCHPFRWRNWLFVHNGYVADYKRLRRELLLAVHPDLFTNIDGSTDSEVLFHLALTFGLADDPIAGLERMAGFVEATAAAAGVTGPALQMTIGVSDGHRLYAVRYASGARGQHPVRQRRRRGAADAVSGKRAVLAFQRRGTSGGLRATVRSARHVARSSRWERAGHRRRHQGTRLSADQPGHDLMASGRRKGCALMAVVTAAPEFCQAWSTRRLTSSPESCSSYSRFR